MANQTVILGYFRSEGDAQSARADLLQRGFEESQIDLTEWDRASSEDRPGRSGLINETESDQHGMGVVDTLRNLFGSAEGADEERGTIQQKAEMILKVRTTEDHSQVVTDAMRSRNVMEVARRQIGGKHYQ